MLKTVFSLAKKLKYVFVEGEIVLLGVERKMDFVLRVFLVVEAKLI